MAIQEIFVHHQFQDGSIPLYYQTPTYRSFVDHTNGKIRNCDPFIIKPWDDNGSYDGIPKDNQFRSIMKTDGQSNNRIHYGFLGGREWSRFAERMQDSNGKLLVVNGVHHRQCHGEFIRQLIIYQLTGMNFHDLTPQNIQLLGKIQKLHHENAINGNYGKSNIKCGITLIHPEKPIMEGPRQKLPFGCADAQILDDKHSFLYGEIRPFPEASGNYIPLDRTVINH